MKQHRFVSFLLTFLFTIGIFFNFRLPSAASAYRGLIIDEVKFEIENTKRGTDYKKSFTVTHDFQDNNKKITLYLRAADFTSGELAGVPIFLAPNSLPQESSVSKWIKFDKESITLDHFGQKETIDFTIHIPENAEPGGHYAAVLISEKNTMDISSNEQSQLGLAKELGPLVILSVEGDIKKDLKANAFYTTNIDGKSNNIYFYPPINIVTEMSNSGNIHVTPRGAIYLFKGSNFQNSIAKFDLNSKNGIILPGTSRNYVNTWDDSFITFHKEPTEDGKFKTKTQYNWDKLSKLRVGKYNVKLLYTTVGDGSDVRTLEMFTSFWLIPWQLIVLTIGALVYLYLKYKKKENEEQEKVAASKNKKEKE